MAHDERILSKEKLLGTESRWRRFGEPVAAGQSLKPDGTLDYGLFGPGSMAWEVLLHPATVILESIGQSLMQLTYKPVAAGIRDHDPLSRKARAGTVTYFDAFERFQRNSGMHAPMWLGDTATAQRMAEHLHRVHQRVASDIIDCGEPALGGYAASAPRDAMWAALTEMHPLLRMYEAFAFRGGWLPRRLPAEKRDAYFAEVVAYVRLVGAEEAEIPKSAAELSQLYDKYAALFGHGKKMNIIPETGQDFKELAKAVMKKNFHVSQLKAIRPLMFQFAMLELPVMGALPRKARRNAGFGPVKNFFAVVARYAFLPVIWVMQQAPLERRLMRLMWGPDGVRLIETARRLHREALAGKKL
jgi:uncharacterized protein (DUF2236 family)